MLPEASYHFMLSACLHKTLPINSVTPTPIITIKIFYCYQEKESTDVLNGLPSLPTTRIHTFALINFCFLALKKSQYKKQMRTLDSFKLNFQKPSLFSLQIKGTKTPFPPPSGIITEISFLLLG